MTITLATLHQHNKQQVFDHVVVKLLTQNKQSQMVIFGQLDPVCAYRGQDDIKCAAGWLIGDDEYLPEMECNSWSDLVAQFDQVPDTHEQFIVDLQTVHDTHSPIVWPMYFARLAGVYGLSIGTMSLFIERQNQA